jgi:dimethylaniline monooxygenase (N-oxide forming)
MNVANVKRVGIVGAGEAGLGTAKMLLTAGYDCKVFERSSKVGGVWSTGYLDFGTQVQRELYEFPDYPLPKNAPDYTPGPQVRSYLQDYADHFGVTPRVRLNTSVVGVFERGGGAEGWTISYQGEDGIIHSEYFDLVVIAVGVYSHTPNILNLKNAESFQGKIIHNSELQSKEQLKGKRVVVVGYGKSATDAALLAADYAASSTIVFREPHWPVPAILTGGIPFKYALFNRFTNAMLPLHMNASRALRIWHKIGKPFIWAFWRMVEKLITHQFGLTRPNRGKSATKANLMPHNRIEYGGFSNSTMLPKPEFFDHIHSGRIGAERTEISSCSTNGVTLANGGFVACDLVVLATGWKTDYGFLGANIRERMNFDYDGCYLYRQVFHPDIPNLAFVGSNAISYINILTHNLQARWLTGLLSGTHELPSKDYMFAEIAAMRKWKRKIVPPSKSRAATLHLHMQQYHDDLLRDMGISPSLKRKKFGILSEMFAPYQPSDYAGVASGKDVQRWDGKKKAHGVASRPGLLTPGLDSEIIPMRVS